MLACLVQVAPPTPMVDVGLGEGGGWGRQCCTCMAWVLHTLDAWQGCCILCLGDMLSHPIFGTPQWESANVFSHSAWLTSNHMPWEHAWCKWDFVCCFLCGSCVLLVCCPMCVASCVLLDVPCVLLVSCVMMHVCCFMCVACCLYAPYVLLASCVMMHVCCFMCVAFMCASCVL